MSSPPPAKTAQTDEKPAKKAGKGKLIMIAAPVVLLLAGAGLWFTGILPHMLGMDKHDGKGRRSRSGGAPQLRRHARDDRQPEQYHTHKPSYVKLAAGSKCRIRQTWTRSRAAMPRLQDMMQTYLREMRPEELRGSAGTYRLREELLVRANAAVAPAKVSDVLFTQMLVQ